MNENEKYPHPAPALIVGEREERKYPIGGYAPGNYSCKCVTCKEGFIGDKRAVQCEPCATKMVEEAGGKDYTRIHVNLPNGAAAAVSPDASPELLNALTKMVDLAKAMPDAPTEQALPEEHPAVKSQKYIPNPNNGTEAHPCAEYAAGLRELLREAHTQLAAANALIKEKQEWINSHM